jgi:hypothetical protein
MRVDEEEPAIHAHNLSEAASSARWGPAGPAQ